METFKTCMSFQNCFKKFQSFYFCQETFKDSVI